MTLTLHFDFTGCPLLDNCILVVPLQADSNKIDNGHTYEQ